MTAFFCGAGTAGIAGALIVLFYYRRERCLRHGLMELREAVQMLECLCRMPATAERDRLRMEQCALVRWICSNLENGRPGSRKKEMLSLFLFLKQCCMAIKPMADRSGTILSVETEGHCMVRAEETALRRILQNLLFYAVKRTGENGQIDLRLTEERGRRRVCLQVRDTGRSRAVTGGNANLYLAARLAGRQGGRLRQKGDTVLLYLRK